MTVPKFIIGCWSQPAAHFPRLAGLGVNAVFGYEPAGVSNKTEYALKAKEAGLWIADQPGAALSVEATQENRLAWMQDDEPDLNRWKDNEPADSTNNSRLIPGPRYKGWTKPQFLVERYARCKSANPDIPVFCNFAGPSITVAAYTHGEGHKPYLAACDWMGFDWHIKNANFNRYTLELVRLAARRLREWGGPDKRLLVYVEVTKHQHHANARVPTPDEAEAMVNVAVEEGASGIIYFTHTFRNGWDPGVLPNGWYGPSAEMEARMLNIAQRLSPEFELTQLKAENAALRANEARLKDGIRRALEALRE